MPLSRIAQGGARSGRSTTRDAATHGHPVIRIGGRPPLPKEVSHPSRFPEFRVVVTSRP
ncbi:hypothetical protein [Azospirillum argentinense]